MGKGTTLDMRKLFDLDCAQEQGCDLEQNSDMWFSSGKARIWPEYLRVIC